MSKLSEAPLIEVIFELRWNSTTTESLTKYQYIHGDLYSEIKDSYKYRESLIPNEIPSEVYVNMVAHRFRKSQNEYPIIQIGPGVLTVNTIDDIYVWENFENEILNVVDKFLKVYPFQKSVTVQPILQYIDFLEFNFAKENVYYFLRDKLHIEVNQSFFIPEGNPKSINLSFAYNTNIGELVIAFNQGKNKMDKEGIMIRTMIRAEAIQPLSEEIALWLNAAHEFCSQLFKDMTEGVLYKSFHSLKS